MKHEIYEYHEVLATLGTKFGEYEREGWKVYGLRGNRDERWLKLRRLVEPRKKETRP
jgi:hypothetical protein